MTLSGYTVLSESVQPAGFSVNANMTNQNPYFKIVLIMRTGICSRVASKKSFDENTDSVTEFIGKCIRYVLPTVTIKSYHGKSVWTFSLCDTSTFSDYFTYNSLYHNSSGSEVYIR
jgi:hypothetical protein